MASMYKKIPKKVDEVNISKTVDMWIIYAVYEQNKKKPLVGYSVFISEYLLKNSLKI